jgi:hypothetical protein
MVSFSERGGSGSIPVAGAGYSLGASLATGKEVKSRDSLLPRKKRRRRRKSSACRQGRDFREEGW